MTNMIYIVVMVILRLLTEIQAGCPINCNCTENSVNCDSKNLEYIPQFETLSNNPIIIDLSGNSISLIDVDDFSFDKSDQVKEVYLNNTGLIAIEEGAFKDLEILQELYLSENLLNSLPDDLITNNQNMVLLDLSSNYFTDMPKIKSESLEVLVLANSGISKISNDALEELPNLRMLLLSQNNLKTVNPVIFQDMSNLFFITISYNPWYCNCKTIKLFDFLTERQFVDLTEPVQCQREDRIFVDIYSDDGVMPAFRDKCDDFDGDFEETAENLEEPVDNFKEEAFQIPVTLKSLDARVNVSLQGNERHLKPSKDVTFSDFSYIIMLAITVVLSLIIGAVCGSYLTFKYMQRNIKQTQSTKELISNYDYKPVTYNIS